MFWNFLSQVFARYSHYTTNMSKSTRSVSILNLTERFSFRGRRKLDSVETVIEPKQQKVAQPNASNKTSSKTKKTSNKTTVSEDQKRKVSPKKPNVKESENIHDIEDCCKQISPKKGDNENIKWFPDNWEQVLKNIQEMRKAQDAPVDDMGCHKTMDANAPPEVRRYQALVSLMLSSQTKDQMTYATMLKLREHGLTVDNMIATDESVVGEIIRSVGFWKTKAKNIKKATQILKDEYNGDIPDTVENLMKLPGVGPKMAHLCMTTAWGKIHGIGVDTHVHRISNRLGWVPRATKTPEQTRLALEAWLPSGLWFEVNHLMVGFGQQTCTPIRPKCSGCLNKELCPYGRSALGVKAGKEEDEFPHR